MHVRVNGEARELAPATTVAELMASLPQERGVAVALDGEVVPRAAWPSTELLADAQIEIVVAVQGG